MRYLLSAVLISAIASCGGSPTSPRAGEIIRISGTVREFSTGAAVPDATVSFGTATAVTKPSGVYSIDVSAFERYEPTIDGRFMGLSVPFGTAYRGDFLVRSGTCVGRYGTVSDLGLHQPIAGATVSLGGQTTVTGADGWYRLDLECPPSGIVGLNTTFIYATHATHADRSQTVGRGIAGVSRIDIEMQRK